MRRLHPIAAVRRAFTLVELLVVIGIIALLISILLPALSKARGAAQTVACSSNLHSLAQAMQIYAAQNVGYLPGSPNTSSKFLLDPTGTFNYSNSNIPGLISAWDWMAPIATAMGVQFDEDATHQLTRFQQLVNNKAFKCPVNDVQVVDYPSGSGVYPMTSYATAVMFLFVNDDGKTPGYARGFLSTPNTSWYNTAQGYSPKIGSIRNSASKVFMADAGGWSDGTKTPDTDIQYNDASNTVSFTDPGPWDSFSRCWNRSNSPGNSAKPIDSRIFGFRHGKLAPNGQADSFRFNVAFYDGHVETMGDLQASDPSLWMPTGSTVGISEFQPDVVTKYQITGTFTAN